MSLKQANICLLLRTTLLIGISLGFIPLSSASALQHSPIQVTSQQSPGTGVPIGNSTQGEPKQVTLQFDKQAPVVSQEKQAWLTAALARQRRPPNITVAGQPTGPTGPESTTSGGLRESAGGPFAVFVDQPVSNTVFRSTVNEPSVGNNGQLVFYTGNWYAARSTDGGSSWSYVDPEADMPDFCCDQDVIFVPSHGIFLWMRLSLTFLPNTDELDRIYVGVSTDAQTWFFYSAYPSDVNAPWSDRGFDYPHFSLTNNYVYITANLFSIHSPYNWMNTIIMRWPLASLAAHTSFGYSYVSTTETFDFSPMHGATTTMYWGSHESTSVLRVFQWPEGGSASYVGRTVDPWFYDGSVYSCPAPDGFNMCGRFSYLGKMRGAYVSGGVIAFFWTVQQGNGFNYPYVRIALFRQSDRAYLETRLIYNTGFAFAYANADPSPYGDIGIVLFTAGPSEYPSFRAAIWIGGVQCFPCYNVLKAGTNGPSNNVWGDYVTIRQYSGRGPLWVAAGYTLQGGSSGSNVEPRYYVLGRDFRSSIPLSSIKNNVILASAGTVTFVLPDFTAPRHTSATKCGGVVAAQLTDYSAGGYILGMLSNVQNEGLDTESSIMSQASGTCGQYTGANTVQFLIAGSGVNEAVSYHERIASDTPAYISCTGGNCYILDRTFGNSTQVWPLTSGNDYFIIEAFQDLAGNTVYILYGSGWTGTLAGAAYFNTVIYPDINSYTKSYYVYHWQDAASGLSHNGFPDPGDTYTLVSSG